MSSFAPARLELGTALGDVDALGAKTRLMLRRAGLQTVGDLLGHYPLRYEDRRHFDQFPSQETPEPVCLRGIVADCTVRRMGFRRYVEVEVHDTDGAAPFQGSLTCRWFNMNWIIRSFAVGQTIVLYGRVKTRNRGGGLIIDHPDFETLEAAEVHPTPHIGRVVPVYPLGNGLSQKPLRAAMHRMLELLEDDAVSELVPAGLDPAALSATLTRAQALRRIHFPATLEEAEQARRQLALEELFLMQLTVLWKRRLAKERTGTVHHAAGGWLERWKDALPFPLTGGQWRSISEIRHDLAARRPMNRLLQGDVGSGKTLVAMAATLLAAESGHRTALLAPTQVLAEQHFLNFQRHLAPLGLSLGLRTGSKEISTAPVGDGESATPQLIVGTHALLHDDALPGTLGLVIIDEQHKFGVAQRAFLASQEPAPDVLVMTATPIPRTLALTLYGDLDVSVLDELPIGRIPVTTRIHASPDAEEIIKAVREHVQAGRQAYLVCPIIDESETSRLTPAATEHRQWQQRLPGLRIGLLHGRLDPQAKEAVMAQFRDGHLQVLVTTTVIEVGIDVPHATLIVIFNAERFGLAQLHQLRGRVGRGTHPSQCLLICSNRAAGGLERLRILESSHDGFEIAEADLQRRGPGEIIGQKQSGLPPLRLANLSVDGALLRTARQLAVLTLESDPGLHRPNNLPLRQFISQSLPLITS